jgi:type I restriction enzyme S subunit
LAGKASGSAQQNLNKSLVSEHKLLIPPIELLEEFEKVTSSLIGSWIHNCKENLGLASARDALLPKLLSGELEARKENIKEEQISYG